MEREEIAEETETQPQKTLEINSFVKKLQNATMKKHKNKLTDEGLQALESFQTESKQQYQTKDIDKGNSNLNQSRYSNRANDSRVNTSISVKPNQTKNKEFKGGLLGDSFFGK